MKLSTLKTQSNDIKNNAKYEIIFGFDVIVSPTLYSIFTLSFFMKNPHIINKASDNAQYGKTVEKKSYADKLYLENK